MFRIVKMGTTEKLILAITTSRFSSGAKYTASALTATFYKVNAGGTALEIDTAIGTAGVVALSADTGSKTGFHTALLDVSALTARIYAVVYEATVDSVAAICTEFLDIDAERKKIADYVDAAVTSRPTLADIEASTVLAMEASVAALPTLTEIEASAVLAMEASVTSLGTPLQDDDSRLPATMIAAKADVAAMNDDLQQNVL